MVVFRLRAEWRCVITTAMELSAMTSGMLLMLLLCADNLDLTMEVCVYGKRDGCLNYSLGMLL